MYTTLECITALACIYTKYSTETSAITYIQYTAVIHEPQLSHKGV